MVSSWIWNGERSGVQAVAALTVLWPGINFSQEDMDKGCLWYFYIDILSLNSRDSFQFYSMDGKACPHLKMSMYP